MLAVAIGAAWAAVVLGAFARCRPAPPRVAGLLPVPARASRTVDPRAVRWLGAAAAAAVVLPLVPLLAPVAALAGWAAPLVRRRRRERAEVAELRRSLPEAIDLVALAVGAGLTVPGAVAAVARRHAGPVADAFAAVEAELAHGRRCGDALDDAAARLGPDARPLLAALSASERYGAPLGEALLRLAADSRADRRRQAEAAARRVPVKLLFPLVLCVLPAFGLLTVAPMLAGALGSLRL